MSARDEYERTMDMWFYAGVPVNHDSGPWVKRSTADAALAEEQERADFFRAAYEKKVAQLHRLHENRQNLAVRIATGKMAGTNSLWPAHEVLQVIGEELDKPTKG